MTVTETMPSSENLLKFMLERRIPQPYRETKEVLHTHNAGALFQEFLERMDDRAKEQQPKLIDRSADDAETASLWKYLALMLDGAEIRGALGCIVRMVDNLAGRNIASPFSMPMFNPNKVQKKEAPGRP